MKSYKCLNPQCNHTWEAKEEYVFECPKCHGNNVVIANGGNSWIKKHVKLLFAILCGACVVTLLILIPQSKTNVEVEKKGHSLVVTLTGSQVNDYQVRLYKKDRTYDNPQNYNQPITFSQLYGGPYKLEIKYTGNVHNAPKLSEYKGEYNFKPLENSNIPAIIQISHSPDKLTKKIKKYTVAIQTDTLVVPIRQTEYSMDGTNWQSEPLFEDVEPGTYVFYVRNKREKSAIDQSNEYTLEPYKPHIVQAEEVNNLLKRIYQDDTNAANELKRLCGSETKVYGLEGISIVSDLCTYIVTSRQLLTCTITVDPMDNEVVKSINIQ